MMARTAALSGAGGFSQAVTIRVRSGQEGIEFRASIRESSSDFPIKSGGERGDSNPKTIVQGIVAHHEIGRKHENHFPKFPPAFCVKITQYSPSMLVHSQA